MPQDYELLKDLIAATSGKVDHLQRRVEENHAVNMQLFHDLKTQVTEQRTRSSLIGSLLSASGPIGLVIAIVAFVHAMQVTDNQPDKQYQNPPPHIEQWLGSRKVR